MSRCEHKVEVGKVSLGIDIYRSEGRCAACGKLLRWWRTGLVVEIRSRDARTRYLLRASLHFPFLKYMNAPQVRCAGAISARKPARRWTFPRPFAPTGALAVCDLADVVAS